MKRCRYRGDVNRPSPLVAPAGTTRLPLKFDVELLGFGMADETEPANDAAGYAREAQKMRDAAAKAFDPGLAAQYLALAAEWLRLAEARGGEPPASAPVQAEDDS